MTARVHFRGLVFFFWYGRTLMGGTRMGMTESAAQRGRAAMHGMTLIELLLAVFVFVAAGAGIVGAYLSTHYLSQHAKETMIALDDLNDMMERVHSTPFTALGGRFPNGVANGSWANPYSNIVGAYRLGSEQITVVHRNPGSDPLELIVTVSWTDRTRARTASASTIRTSS